MIEDDYLFYLSMRFIFNPSREEVNINIQRKYKRVAHLIKYVDINSENKVIDPINNYYALVVTLNEYIKSNCEGYFELMNSDGRYTRNNSDYFGSIRFNYTYKERLRYTPEGLPLFRENVKDSLRNLTNLIISSRWLFATGKMK